MVLCIPLEKEQDSYYSSQGSSWPATHTRRMQRAGVAGASANAGNGCPQRPLGAVAGIFCAFPGRTQATVYTMEGKGRPGFGSPLGQRISTKLCKVLRGQSCGSHRQWFVHSASSGYCKRPIKHVYGTWREGITCAGAVPISTVPQCGQYGRTML